MVGIYPNVIAVDTCGGSGDSISVSLRPWHRIKTVKGQCVPDRIVVFQVAPQRREIERGLYQDTLLCGHVRCYWLSNGEVVREQAMDFGRAEQLWDFIGRVQRKDGKTWVFGHSLGYQLTLLDFWQRLDTPSERHLWSVLSDPPTIICTRRGRRVVIYVDTVNYFREPLPSLFGGRDQWHCWALDERAPVYDHIAWCRKVTHRLGELLCRMIRIAAQEIRCTWACTAASLSWNVYRKWYMTSPVWVHGHPEASRLELDALFGGLLKVSKLGPVNSATQAWDVNSLYPWAMSTQPIPNKLVRYYHEPTIPLLHSLLSRHYCVAEVDVEVPPFELPYRRAAQSGFTRARGRYVLCGTELEESVRFGMVTACYRMATYEQADLFSGFVRDIYPRKLRATLDGDVAARWIWKLVLNGLSGKFSQRSRTWTDAKEIISPHRWCYFWYKASDAVASVRMRCIAGSTQRLEERGLKRDSMPIITSAITSAGRTRIRELTALSVESDAFYTDCDCLHVGITGARTLANAGVCDDRRIGALKLVVEGPDAHYWGPKHYRIGDYYVSNVVHLGARKLEDGYWLQQTKRGLEWTLQSGVLDRVIVKDQLVKVG